MNVRTVEELLNWRADLPTVLQVDVDDRETPYLPHVILLQLVYHSCTLGTANLGTACNITRISYTLIAHGCHELTCNHSLHRVLGRHTHA